MALNERNAGGANGSAERDSRLERLYHEAGSETPPAHLDAAILAAARREVGARPRAFTATLRRWHVPVSIAAVVMVSVSLVILVWEEGGDQMVQAPTSTVTTPAEPPARLASKPSLAEPASERDPPRAATPTPQRRESRDDARSPAALSKRADSARPDPGAPKLSGTGIVAKPEPATAPLPQPFLTPPRAAEERAATPPADAVTAGRMAGVPAAASEPPVARSAPDAPPAEAMARAMQSKPPEQDAPPVWHGFEKEPPQKWLDRIEELKRQGRAAEAEEMLSEFKRRFPAHPLPLGAK